MTQISEDITEIKITVAKTKSDISWIKKALETHMSRHFQVRIAMIASLIAAGTAILIAIL